MNETPDIVYGRLLEAAHLGGYAAERVASEFKWLLVESRWKQAGGGFDDIDKFLAAINLSQYRISIDDRKEIVKMLDAERATQRAAAKALGVSHTTVQNDLGNSLPKERLATAALVEDTNTRGNNLPLQPKAWFQESPAEITKPAQAAEIREERRKETEERLTEIRSNNVEPPTGKFDVIVVDPPWPIEKIERDERPNQVKLDYPTMSEAELLALDIPAADDCHLWLWTTHKFLPVAFRLLAEWEFRYVCTFVWHKPGGFQPIGLPQYNCEFALYARKGSPKFIDTKKFSTCMEAPRTGHSEKPEAFYEMIRRVTDGMRFDMFNRRPIEGFEGWGNESMAE